jgi:carotenoid cleavage dioxygenase
VRAHSFRSYGELLATGTLANSFSIALVAPTMIHDFVLTERYIVLLASTAVFDGAAAR